MTTTTTRRVASANLDEALATFRFSTYGWILLSAVVEAAAGEPRARFMTREIVEPLGMQSTVLEDGDEVDDITSFYTPRASMRTKLGRAVGSVSVLRKN